LITAEPSELLRHVFDAHEKNYGEPDMHYPFDPVMVDGQPVVERLDVFVWRPNTEVPMTTFSTIGMSGKKMPGVDHRCEIHFTVRGRLTENEESETARVLANLAVYPFLQKTYFDYWHILPHLEMPKFFKCSAGIFHPAFTKDGWDTIESQNDKIKILNLVPITPQERATAQTAGVSPMLNALYDHRVDIFSDRK
jgi:hypothetical protein